MSEVKSKSEIHCPGNFLLFKLSFFKTENLRTVSLLGENFNFSTPLGQLEVHKFLTLSYWGGG